MLYIAYWYTFIKEGVSIATKEAVLEILEKRFNEHMNRHKDVSFDYIKEKLSNEKLFKSVELMEQTGGEPDVLLYNGLLFFVDFSKETTKGRTSICYDKKARLERTKFPPATSAEEMALDMGIELLDEPMYHYIQSLEDFDLKTSSWLKTELDTRSRGGAIFGDKRYNRTFIYHNGADSYYGSRGFRGILLIEMFVICD